MITERGKITFGKKNIEFFVKRSNRRRTISIFVDPVEGVFLRAPLTPSFESLSKLVYSKATWVLDKQRRINETIGRLPKKEFVSGESFLYLGRHLRLKILNLESKSKNRVSVKQGHLIVSFDAKIVGRRGIKSVRDVLMQWYKCHARITLLKRMRIFLGKLSVPMPDTILANQTKRWGSCNEKGQIRFNWHIIMAPMSLIDYVVAHELCHLKHINHSEDFWKLLGSVMPDYENRRERLRREGPKYYF